MRRSHAAADELIRLTVDLGFAPPDPQRCAVSLPGDAAKRSRGTYCNEDHACHLDDERLPKTWARLAAAPQLAPKPTPKPVPFSPRRARDDGSA